MKTPTENAALTDIRVRLERWLQCCFPTWPAASVEDAVADAMTTVLSKQGWALPADMRLLRTVAWRGLRAEWRRPRPQRIGLRAPATADPTGRIEARSTLRRLNTLIEPAVEEFGGRKKSQVRSALVSRLADGESDTAVARQHGVRREAINRARRAMIARI